ncbi:MAG: lysoplasmalogenase family protein [Burkholderiaceae bacterium]
MTASQVIVLAIPVFLLMMLGEFAWSRHRGIAVYRFSDAVNSLSLGGLSQLSGLFTKLLAVGIYTAVYDSVALFPDLAFWSTWYGVVLALVFYDFCYYWLHRAGHEVAVFWAAHVVHHQSQHYNLSTALRQTSSGALLGWVFYLPMAVAGVPPLIFGIVALIDLLYQFWVHTELVRKLGWFDRVFCSPSNHRVHHAVNDAYLDKNYGGILILWDRMFGSFREEGEPCVYGTRAGLRSWDPIWANAEVYAQLAQDSWRARNWLDKLRVWFKPPGWRPADVAARWPKPAFDLAQVQLYDPPVAPAAMAFVGTGFVLLLGGVAALLWFAHTLDGTAVAVWGAALLAIFWALGAVLQSRLGVWAALMLTCAALATASATLGLQQVHYLFKPMTMAVAIVLVLRRQGAAGSGHGWLVAALLASMAGDVLLMLPGNLFIPGLAAFLLAHLCYIALFRRQQAWFPNRPALVLALATGGTMLALFWDSLGDAGLKAAVSAYVVVISLMAAQAIGRATVLQDRASTWVAIGACVFMLSDTLIAINRFLTPVPLASLWILGTYYLAQMLIVLHAPGHAATTAAAARTAERDAASAHAGLHGHT